MSNLSSVSTVSGQEYEFYLNWDSVVFRADRPTTEAKQQPIPTTMYSRRLRTYCVVSFVYVRDVGTKVQYKNRAESTVSPAAKKNEPNEWTEECLAIKKTQERDRVTRDTRTDELWNYAKLNERYSYGNFRWTELEEPEENRARRDKYLRRCLEEVEHRIFTHKSKPAVYTVVAQCSYTCTYVRTAQYAYWINQTRVLCIMWEDAPVRPRF